MAKANITQNIKSICYTFFEDLFNQLFLRKIQMFGYENLNTNIDINNIKEKSYDELNEEQKIFFADTLIDIPKNNRIFCSLTNEYFKTDKPKANREKLILFIKEANRPKYILSLIYSIIKLLLYCTEFGYSVFVFCRTYYDCNFEIYLTLFILKIFHFILYDFVLSVYNIYFICTTEKKFRLPKLIIITYVIFDYSFILTIFILSIFDLQKCAIYKKGEVNSEYWRTVNKIVVFVLDILKSLLL